MISFGNLDFPKRANKSVLMPCVQPIRSVNHQTHQVLTLFWWHGKLIMTSVAGVGLPKIWISKTQEFFVNKLCACSWSAVIAIVSHQRGTPAIDLSMPLTDIRINGCLSYMHLLVKSDMRQEKKGVRNAQYFKI